MFLCRILICPYIVKEGGRTTPLYPSIFIKPSATLGNFDTPVLVTKVAQEQLDYGGELVGTPEIKCMINRADTYRVGNYHRKEGEGFQRGRGARLHC